MRRSRLSSVNIRTSPESDVSVKRRQRGGCERQQYILQVVGKIQEAKSGHTLGAGSSNGDKQTKVFKFLHEGDRSSPDNVQKNDGGI